MNKTKKILWILIIALWMLVIFAFSSLNGEGSDDQSKGLAKAVVETTVRDTSQARRYSRDARAG